MKLINDIEQSLRKKYHKKIFSPFAKAINKYELLEPNDKIAVCISGGKDSFLLAKCFQELKRHNKFDFDIEFISMDPGYNKENRKLLEKNAEELNIPLKIFDTDIFDTVYNIEKSPCYLCARMRRGNLYAKAQSLGCNKIALAHHYDDVIETILMSMLYGGQIQSMPPKLRSANFSGMELIRPLYLVREEDIIRWRDDNEIQFLNCACRFTENCVIEEDTDEITQKNSKRKETKSLIKAMKKINPYVEGNIFKSVENVHLDTLIKYKTKGRQHSFLEDY